MNEVNRRSLDFQYLLFLEEEQLEQRGVCRDEHNRHFLVLKDIPVLLVHHGQPIKEGYAAAGDAVGLPELILGQNERSMLKNDEEWSDIPELLVLAELRRLVGTCTGS